MNKIIVLQGPPASGKSTKAKELLEQYGADKAVIVCRDSIRESSGEYWVPSREDIDDCREITTQWINDNIYRHKWTNMGIQEENWKLLMRAKGDHRSDDVVKKEIWETKIKPWWDVVAVFDDRDKVVKMWRDLGLLCCQVYYGDF